MSFPRGPLTSPEVGACLIVSHRKTHAQWEKLPRALLSLLTALYPAQTRPLYKANQELKLRMNP